MNAETRAQVAALAREGDSYAAFRSVALAVGLTPRAAEAVWTAAREDAGGLVVDVRESGLELRSEQGWVLSTDPVDVEDYR